MLAGDIDPFAAGLYIVEAERRSILLRGDDPRFTDHLLERCRRDAVDVVVPTVDTELLPLARRRADFAAIGTTLVLASEKTLETCLDKWVLAERCREQVRVRKRPVVVDADFDPCCAGAAGDRQAPRGSGSRASG